MVGALFERNPSFVEESRSFWPELEKLRVDNVTMNDELDQLKTEETNLEVNALQLYSNINRTIAEAKVPLGFHTCACQAF